MTQPSANPLPIAQPEVIEVDTTTVACEGGDGGALGHPRVFLSLVKGGETECPYCDRRFVLDKATAERDAH